VAEGPVFDPRVILTALEEARVNYVVIGSLARVLQGSDEVAHGVDICIQRKGENIDRLAKALDRLAAQPQPLPIVVSIWGRSPRTSRCRSRATRVSCRSCRCLRARAVGGTTCAGARSERHSVAACASPSRRSMICCGWRRRSPDQITRTFSRSYGSCKSSSSRWAAASSCSVFRSCGRRCAFNGLIRGWRLIARGLPRAARVRAHGRGREVLPAFARACWLLPGG
jgi:hypothetical protein